MRKLLVLLVFPILLAGCMEKRTVVVQSERSWSPVALYQKAAPAVATILSAEGSLVTGQGSGFLVEGNYIVTNAHVVLPDGRKAESVWVEWSSGNRAEAEVLRVDPNTDLAILRAQVPGGVEPLRLSSRDEIFPGEPVAAIGSPFGEAQSLSTGIISAVDRSVRSLTDFSIDDAIQTDASINPGNSGGPLLDARGQVLGINQQIQTNSGGNDGVGYAVPAAALARIITSLEKDEPLRYAWMGVSIQEVWPELAERLRVPAGALLLGEVVPGGPADRAGLRGGSREEVFQGTPVRFGGDVILRIGNRNIRSSGDLQDVLVGTEPGDVLSVVVLREGEKVSLRIRLGDRRDQ